MNEIKEVRDRPEKPTREKMVSRLYSPLITGLLCAAMGLVACVLVGDTISRITLVCGIAFAFGFFGAMVENIIKPPRS